MFMEKQRNSILVQSDIFKPVEIRRICAQLPIAAGIHPDIGYHKPAREEGAQDTPIYTFGNGLLRLWLGGNVETVSLPIRLHFEKECQNEAPGRFSDPELH
jgi:hypothetical protein